MPTPLTRTLALILSLAAATWALQRPATHSLARRRGTPLLAAKDARRAAPLLTVARREGQLSRMQNVEGWRGNNGRWRKYEEIKECAAGRRSYVPVGDFFNLETPDPIMDSTLGVRILFAIIVGTLVSFNSLAADYNRPFRGAFKIESETVTASLRQLRETLSPYCDVNGCVVPESADESSGFGGIISPPWWDDFQEP